MSYPTYFQDFEGGTTLAAACPELIDFSSAFAIDSSGSHAFTGTNSLKLTDHTTSHDILSNVADSLSGGVTFSAYMQNGTSTAPLSIYARTQPTGQDTPPTFLRLRFDSAGLSLIQNSAGTLTTLNTPISGVSLPTGVWLCLELRCNGTTISGRVIRQDTGAFFINTGSGSWSAPNTPPAYGASNQGTSTIAVQSGGFGFRGGDAASLYLDSWTYGPAVPSIDIPSFSLNAVGLTKQLTAGGFTDPRNFTGGPNGTAGTHVTWSSSNTGVATVSTTGLVTAVGAGTATITATGKRDTGQTATSTATITTGGATAYTLTGPSSGIVNVASTNFTVTPNGTYTGTVTITPSGGGLTSPIVLTFSGAATPQTFTITPTAIGTVTLTPTNSGSLADPSPPLSYVVNLAPATSYTLTAPSPSSGPPNVVSGNFTVQPNGPFTGQITITPSGGGLSNPIVLNFSGAAPAQTFTITPTIPGTVTLTPTNGGGLSDPSAATYTVTLPAATSYSLTPPSPSSGFAGSTSGIFTVAPNGTFTGTITITPSGGGLSSPIVLNFTGTGASQTFTIMPSVVGTVTLTGTNSGTLTNPSAVTYRVDAALTTVPKYSTVQGFAGGLLGTVGYTVWSAGSNVTPYIARTTATTGPGSIGYIDTTTTTGYAADVQLPVTFAGSIVWDDGSGRTAIDEVSPRFVEPSSGTQPGGLTNEQALAEVLSAVAGLVSGFQPFGGGSPTFLAPDGVTKRITGTVDKVGNRSAITLSPPT